MDSRCALLFRLHNFDVSVLLAEASEGQRGVSVEQSGENEAHDIEDPSEDENVRQIFENDDVQQHTEMSVPRQLLYHLFVARSLWFEIMISGHVHGTFHHENYRLWGENMLKHLS